MYDTWSFDLSTSLANHNLQKKVQKENDSFNLQLVKKYTVLHQAAQRN